jgi:single-strand DNA-binding protein
LLNIVTIMGRMVRDPELRRTGSGLAVTNFTVAVDRDRSGQDGQKETDFIDCVAWRQTAEFVSKYFTKGRMIVVSGRLQITKWEKDGKSGRKAEVVADNCYFGDTKRDSEGGNAYVGSNYGSEQTHSQNQFSQRQDYQYPYPGQKPVTADDFALLDDDDNMLPF